MEFSRKNKEMVLGLLKFNKIETWVFGLNLDYLNFEFCLQVNQEKVLDFSLAILNTYEFLVLTNDSVGHYRRYDKEIHVIGTEHYTKDRRVLLSKFIGIKDHVWLFYSDSTLEILDAKLKKLWTVKTIQRVSRLVRSKSGFMIANKAFEFQRFELDYQSKSERPFKVQSLRIDESCREILDKEQLNCFDFSDKQSRLYLRCFSGMIGRLDVDSEGFVSKLEVDWEKHHSETILDLDVCSWKPWIISVGQDKSLSIWNYMMQQVEMTWTFGEELLSVAIHPQGFFFCVGMSDKAIVYTLLANSVGEFQKKVLKEIFLKNVYKVKFSKGGNFLVICSENPNAVNVFHFQRMHCPSFLALKGHTSQIQDIQFSRFNGFLYTCSKDGMLYKWSLKDGSRQEMFSRGPPLYGICVLNDQEDQRKVVAVSDETGGLIVMKNDKKTYSKSAWSMTCLLFGRKSDRMFVGLTHTQGRRAGCVRMYVGPEELDKFQDFPVHDAQGVKKLLFMDNESKLASLGFDNTVSVIKIQGHSEGDKLSNKILVTKRYIENLRSEVAYLTTSLDDDKGLNSNIITLNHLDHTIKELKENIEEQKKADGQEVKRKEEAKKDLEQKNREHFDTQKKKKESDISELENFHSRNVTKQNSELGGADQTSSSARSSTCASRTSSKSTSSRRARGAKSRRSTRTTGPSGTARSGARGSSTRTRRGRSTRTAPSWRSSPRRSARRRRTSGRCSR